MALDRSMSVALLPGVVIVLLWEWLTFGASAAAFLCGRPHEVAFAMAELLCQRETWWNLLYTVSAIVSGLALGGLCGAVGGLLLATFPFMFLISRSYLIVLGAIPVIAFAPLVVLWLGIGWWSKVCLAAYAAGLVTLQLTLVGATEAARRYRDVIELGEASRLRVVLHVVMPGAMLWLTEGYRASIGAAVLGAFIGECLNSDAGIGHMMMRASGLYRVNEVWCGVMMLGAVALLLSQLLEQCLRLVAPGHARLLRSTIRENRHF